MKELIRTKHVLLFALALTLYVLILGGTSGSAALENAPYIANGGTDQTFHVGDSVPDAVTISILEVESITISWSWGPEEVIYNGNKYIVYGRPMVLGPTPPSPQPAIFREEGNDGLTFSNEVFIHRYGNPTYGRSWYPRIVKAGSNYYMYHTDYYIWASGQWAYFVARLESTDGYSWSNDISVLQPHDKSYCDGDWEAGQIIIQDIIYDNGVYHIWYIGTYRWQCVGSFYYPSLGYANSTDGVNFVNRQRIVDENGNFINESHSEWTGGWATSRHRVFKFNDLYYMLYPKDGDIKYRTSDDGVHWQHKGIFLANDTIASLTGSTGNLYPESIFEDKDGTTYLYFCFGSGCYRIILSSLLNIAPIADAGTDQTVHVGSIVTLDGSGSSDANNNPLTYKWEFSSVPEGSQSAIVDPTAMITSFFPELTGTYVVQLTVNDGFVDSNPSTIQVEVVTLQTLTIMTIQDLETEIALLDPIVLKNANMQNTLINKLNDIIANIEADNYEDALGQLQNDVLAKTNGCADIGAPDKNDWIKDCESQEIIYPYLLDVIEMVEEFGK